MSVYPAPELRQDEREVLSLIESFRADLRDRIAEQRRWSGTLRKLSFARAVQGSNSIEGYNASLDDVVAAVEGEEPLDATEETQLALAGYRDAMTYILQIAGDPDLSVNEGLLKSLQFMMMKHDLGKNPGQWRPGEIYVRNEQTGAVASTGPDADLVPQLVTEMLKELASSTAPPLITAAMAHLNLVMIHPFSDGNGRMARALQTLILTRDEIAAPLFSSIEEFLGRNTQAYYDVLADVGRGGWNPGNDPRPWLRFCLRAHYLQVRTFLRRREEMEKRWADCRALAEGHHLPERCAAGLLDASFGLRNRRKGYQTAVEEVTGETISDLTASRDLRALVEAGLLEPVGERRARFYLAAAPIVEIQEQIRENRAPRGEDDPFVVIQGDRPVPGRQLSLGEAAS